MRKYVTMMRDTRLMLCDVSLLRSVTLMSTTTNVTSTKIDQKHREDAEKHVLNHRLHKELGLPENITYQISEHLCVTAKSLSNQQTYPMFLMYKCKFCITLLIPFRNNFTRSDNCNICLTFNVIPVNY